jgi:hypothetical protein
MGRKEEWGVRRMGRKEGGMGSKVDGEEGRRNWE